MRGLLAALLCGLLAACQGVPVHEVRSAFSHILISDYGAQRMMLFVDADGDTTVETVMHRDQPHRLQHPYSHTLMAGLLYLPDPPNPSAGLGSINRGGTRKFADRALSGPRQWQQFAPQAAPGKDRWLKMAAFFFPALKSPQAFQIRG